MKEQIILYPDNNYADIDKYICEHHHKNIMLVAGKSLEKLSIATYFATLEERLGCKVVRFSNFKPNPLYDSVVEGVELLKKHQCTLVIAVGGGSAMDVAKCIKLYGTMDDSISYLEQEAKNNNIELMVMPTTAGTGSEATRYAVIYVDGKKQSVTHNSIIPTAVIWDPDALSSLPLYQRKATMLDALCHAMESCWSVHSTKESMKDASKAISMIVENYQGYLENRENENRKQLEASFLAGRAINVTATTAGHAMSYKLTGLYGISHGHAVAACVYGLFPYMVEQLTLDESVCVEQVRCIDPRGVEHVKSAFAQIAEALGCEDIESGVRRFQKIYDEMNFDAPTPKAEDLDVLVNSVNPERLKNNPIRLDEETIRALYGKILKTGEESES